jgi:hypothetical protein
VDYFALYALACCATQQGDFLVGAQLMGAHDGMEERSTEPMRGYWSDTEMAVRENSRVAITCRTRR